MVAYANRVGVIAGRWADLDVRYRCGAFYLHIVLDD